VTKTLIHLIRHGETDWNATNRYQGSSDIPLNDTGRDQAVALAETMRGESWDLIVSSPLSRAMDTAKAVAGAIGIPEDDIVPDKRAQERSYGDAEGLTLSEREKVWPDGEWPGLESWENVALRAMELLDELVASHAGERILVVCHGGFINSILATISGGEVGTGKSVILNTSRTELTHDGSSWEIGAISDVSHLDDVVTA
jgi:broad specificity phosphatase PhoE